MDKTIWKLTGEWSYFLGNILVEIRVAFLPYYPLILSLLKHKNVDVFFNQKMKNPNKGSSLNNDINNKKKLKVLFVF